MDIQLGKAVDDGTRIGRIFASVFFLLVRPIILTTRVMLRKDLGERYVSQQNALVGALLIAAGMWLTAAIPVTTEVVGQNEWGSSVRLLVREDRSTVSYIIGSVWLVMYAAALLDHRVRVRRRYANGVRWHSRCAGVPRLSGTGEWAMIVALGGLAYLGFYFHLPFFAALLTASLVLALAEDGHAAMEFWNRVLDAVDGEIEAENLGKAVKDCLSPDRVEGVHAPTPAYVKDEYRRRIADIIHTDQAVILTLATVSSASTTTEHGSIA
ncbi:MAG: hypothetical protein IBJ18_04060 [Phycisphaerales bacterium]|nr:hypothetical protein [Phycisphaerales bacterium]